jgi:hypothetical protein
MIDVKNVLEVVNEVLVLPVAIITFFLLIYIVSYLWKKDPDVVRSRIFLKFNEIKKAFILFLAFALILIFHVSLIYIPHFFSLSYSSFIYDLQRIFGLLLILILIAFVYVIFKSIRNSNSEFD